MLKLENGVEVLCEILHPMAPGGAGNPENAVPTNPTTQSAANYITQVVFRLNGNVKAEFFLGKSVSRHPVIGTVFTQANAGDKVKVSWQDLAGNSGQATATIE